MPKALEPGDELGLPWDEWADGRVWRVTRDREFLGNPGLVEEAAENAAQRLGKAVRIQAENRLSFVHLWLQFADHEIEAGMPCPACGKDDLLWVNEQLVICDWCRRTSFVVQPKGEKTAGVEDEILPGKGDDLLELLLGLPRGAIVRPAKALKGKGARAPELPADDQGGDGAAAEPKPGSARKRAKQERAAAEAQGQLEAEPSQAPAEQAEQSAPAAQGQGTAARKRNRLLRRQRESDPAGKQAGQDEDAESSKAARRGENRRPREQVQVWQRDDFSVLRLFHFRQSKRKETYAGYGATPLGQMLLVVAVDRVVEPSGEAPSDQTGISHSIRALPAAPFASVLDLRALDRNGESTDIDEVFGAQQPGAVTGESDATEQSKILQLSDFSNIRLLSQHTSETADSFAGVGVDSKDREVLLLIEFERRDGAAVVNPEAPFGLQHRVEMIEAEPFAPALDREALDRARPLEDVLAG